VIGILSFLHQRFAFALILFAALLGIWGTVSFLRTRQVSAGFRSSYVLMIALTGIQGALGLILITMTQPKELLHVVYGGFAFLFLPGVYFWAGRGTKAREAAFLAAACWIVAIAFGRGILTGG
jgi:heme A synthase